MLLAFVAHAHRIGFQVLFDPAGRIKKYETPEEILEEFYTLRLTFYQKRKEWLAGKLTEEYERLDNKVGVHR